MLQKRIVQLAALVALFALFLFTILLSKGYLLDPDIWWHLKVGDWVLQHRAVPTVGILSRTAATRPWVAYSWGFEVILSLVYAQLGLLGFAYFGIAMSLLVSVVLFGACFVISRRFWPSWLLTLLGTFSFAFAVYPRPVFFSMMLFSLMLSMLLRAQRTGRIQLLFWFPLLFLIWANLHIQFIYGLATLGLYIAVDAAMRLASCSRVNISAFRVPTLPLSIMSGVFAASTIASCIGPYSYRLFAVVIGYSRATQTYAVIQELLAPSFKSFTHYVFLLALMAGFYAVGWRKKIDLFQLCLLIAATACAFRTVRDAWFAAIPAILFLADVLSQADEREPAFSRLEITGLTVSVSILALLLGSNMGLDTRGIDFCVSAQFPVDAANFLRKVQPPGPIYNNFDWGGFLTFYLPNYPVSIDGRNDLYGDAYVSRYLLFNSGDRTDGDPQLDEAGVVLLSKDASLAKLLKYDPRFRLIYEDQMADVFAHN